MFLGLGCSKWDSLASREGVKTVRASKRRGSNSVPITDPAILDPVATLSNCLPSTTVNLVGLGSLNTHLPK